MIQIAHTANYRHRTHEEWRSRSPPQVRPPIRHRQGTKVPRSASRLMESGSLTPAPAQATHSAPQRDDRRCAPVAAAGRIRGGGRPVPDGDLLRHVFDVALAAAALRGEGAAPVVACPAPHTAGCSSAMLPRRRSPSGPGRHFSAGRCGGWPDASHLGPLRPLPPASARSRVDGDRRRRRGAAQTTVWGRPCTRVPPVFKRNRR
jgi:hypothetical protein